MSCLTKTVAAIVGVACGLVACRSGESLSDSPEAEDFESASLYDPAHVASLPDAAFVVEADIAAMTELGIVRPDDPHLPFSFVEDVPRLFDMCGSALPSGVTQARTAYYRLEDEVRLLSRRRRYGAITALTGKVDWEPLIECLRRVPAAAPVTFGQLEGVRVELDDPTTCEPELAATVIADGPVLYVGDPELLQKHLVHAMRAKALDQAPTGIAERWADFTKGKVLSAIFVETPLVFYELNYFFPTKGETQAVFMGLERAGDGSELRAVATVPQGDSKDTRRWVARFLDAAETALHPGRATQPPGDLVGKYGESAVSFTRVVTSAWARELALGDAEYLLWRMRAAKREPQETRVHPKPRTYSPITVPTDIPQSTAKLADAHAGSVVDINALSASRLRRHNI